MTPTPLDKTLSIQASPPGNRQKLGLKPRQIIMLLTALVFVAAKSYEGLHTYLSALPA